MATKAKIKIFDEEVLREELDALYETSSQVQLCKYALSLAMHIMEMVEYEDMENPILIDGFRVNKAWQQGFARMHDVRQAGFKIHQFAKAHDDLLIKTALRVVGQAVSTGHMKEHAMVASDYAIKVVNIKYPRKKEAVQQERIWQIETLKSIEETKNNTGEVIVRCEI